MIFATDKSHFWREKLGYEKVKLCAMIEIPLMI